MQVVNILMTMLEFNVVLGAVSGRCHSGCLKGKVLILRPRMTSLAAWP